MDEKLNPNVNTMATLTSITTRFAGLSARELAAAQERANKSRDAEIEKHLKKIAAREKYGYTSLPEHEWDIAFESLEVIDQNRETMTRINRWLPTMQKGVLLYGPVGTGKSTICKAIINRFASPSYRCKFIAVSEALAKIRSAIDQKDTSVGHECQKLVAPDLLILDDLGTDNASEWAKEQIFAIFEARAHATTRKHTWFTTNMNPSTDIPKIYGPRIYDRMHEFCTRLKVPGDSFRKMKYRDEI